MARSRPVAGEGERETRGLVVARLASAGSSAGGERAGDTFPELDALDAFDAASSVPSSSPLRRTLPC